MSQNRKKLVITGISGLLGSNLAYCLKEKYDILGLYNAHEVQIKDASTKKVDLLDRDLTGRILKNFNPDIIIHSAALTNIEFCEQHQEEAREANVTATKNLVKLIENSAVKFFYISTDAVYDGVKGHYSEEDKVNPPNFYAVTKCQAELEALRQKQAVVARVNFFGWNVQDKFSLGEWVINQLSAKKEIKGFVDVFFSSIYTFDLAKLIDLAIEKDIGGIFHFASSTSLSKYEFALNVVKLFNLNSSLIKPISVDDFSFVAKRGKNLSLSTAKLEKSLSYKIPTLPETLNNFYRDFQMNIPGKIKSCSGSRYAALH